MTTTFRQLTSAIKSAICTLQQEQRDRAALARTQTGMDRHQTHLERRAFRGDIRALLLVYALLRNRPYLTVEPKTSHKPEPALLARGIGIALGVAVGYPHAAFFSPQQLVESADGEVLRWLVPTDARWSRNRHQLAGAPPFFSEGTTWLSADAASAAPSAPLSSPSVPEPAPAAAPCTASA